MTRKKYKLKLNEAITHCPKCGNNTEFTCAANQVCEYGCEIWCECKCGYDPTEDNHNNRIECVWGGTSFGDLQDALGVWNDLITPVTKTTQK